MNKKIKSFLKLFILAFVSFIVISVVLFFIFSIFRKIKIKYELILVEAFIFSLLLSLLNLKSYLLYHTDIHSQHAKDSAGDIKQYLVKKRWTILKEDVNEVVFKAPKLENLFTENLSLNLLDDGLSFTGSYGSVKELMKEFQLEEPKVTAENEPDKAVETDTKDNPKTDDDDDVGDYLNL